MKSINYKIIINLDELRFCVYNEIKHKSSLEKFYNKLISNTNKIKVECTPPNKPYSSTNTLIIRTFTE